MEWFFVVSISISLLLPAYVGHRLFTLFNLHKQPYAKKILFWLFIMIAGLSFIVSRIISSNAYWVLLITAYLFAFFLCLFLTCVIFDLIAIAIRCLTRKVFVPGRKIRLGFLLLLMAIFGNGLYMASFAKVVYYPVTLTKSANVQSLRIVQVSDIHINELTSVASVERMIKQINQLDADYIFITGDTLDLRLKPFIDKNMARLFAQLKSTYGTLIIMGNHEYYGVTREKENSEQAIATAFSSAHMHVLQDEVCYLAETGIYVIGRRDHAVDQLISARMPLADLMVKTDKTKPILLLDHQPLDLSEPAHLGVDIMFSGHTHGGQVFPATLLVGMIYENARGMLQKVVNQHRFTSIVTSGYGFWGPPIRLMSQSEIAVIDIDFRP